jgi:hypothetical protein
MILLLVKLRLALAGRLTALIVWTRKGAGGKCRAGPEYRPGPHYQQYYR